MKHLKISLLLFAIVGCGTLQAQLQGQAKIDSLLKELPKQKDDTNKVNLLNTLGSDYSNIDPGSGIKYGQMGLVLATKLDWKKGIAKVFAGLGVNYWYSSDYPKALEYYSKALKMYEDQGDKKGISTVTGNMGSVYETKGDYPRALEYYFKALKIDKEIGNKNWIAMDISNIGGIYKAESDYPKAQEYFLKALHMMEEIGDKNGVAAAAFNIGSVYEAEGEYPKALEYFFKALKLAEEMGNKNGIAMVSGNIGLVYDNQGDYPKALEYFFKALKLGEEIGNKFGVAIRTSNIGNVYSSQHNYMQAVAWHFRALKMAEETGAKDIEANVLGNIGRNYIGIVTNPAGTVKTTATSELPAAPYLPDSLIPVGKQALLHKAVRYLNRAIAMQKEIGNLDGLQKSYKFLSTADSLLGDYKGALDAYLQHSFYKDSVFSKDNAKKIVQQQMKYEYTKKEDSLKLISADKEKVAALKLQRQRSYTLVGVGGILVLVVFSFFMFRNNKLLGKEKERSDDLLQNILPAEVATELKNKGTTTARHYDNVTVLFTDFVNFTQAGENMSPQNLIDELHTCFKAFDEITVKYNIEKIKTIGDAYLAVAGLPTADPRHAENIVRAAKEITAFMEDRLGKMGTERTFQIRVGVHSGSVVAGVVGVKKFAYDIWGDTVNTAARMEQNSEAGKINISQTTYDLVKDKTICEYRGEIDVKGKGVMKMYYIS